MQQPANTIEGTLRNLHVLHSAILLSMVLYIGVAEKVVPHPPRVLNPVFPLAFGFFSLSAIGFALFVRTKKIRPALDALQAKPDDRDALGSWKSGTVLTDVMVECVVLFGFAQRFLGATPAQAAPFYITGIALMLLWWPRRP